MAWLRAGLAQIDCTVGDLDGNVERVLTETKRLVAGGAHLVAFPEMALTGYPAEDLVLRRSFAAGSRAALEDLASRLAAAGLSEVAVIVGYLDRDAEGVRNAAGWLQKGAVQARYFKHHLPTYGVFDEDRYFTAGSRFPVIRLRGVDVGLTICEDLWEDGGPIAVARAAQVGLVVCLNGSPYERGKGQVRAELVRRRAQQAGAALAYVNLIGGQDELVFDGESLVAAADGRLISRAVQFNEELLLVDLDLPPASGDVTGPVDAHDGTAMTIERVTMSTESIPVFDPVAPRVAERLDPDAEVYAALVLGTRDYVRKNRFPSVVLGLSGGIDSALTATIAVDALGADGVHTVALPSAYSSAHSLEDAAELAARQGTRHTVIDIQPVVDGFAAALAGEDGLHGVAAENLQARVRGTTLMALSNKHGHLVLTTGNKSELATGFSTLYGDSAGGFAPIKDVPKTLAWRLARWRNAQAETRGQTPPIPQRSIDKPPSAELAPGQLDSDRLPAYDELDRLLDDYVERDLGRDELLSAGHDPQVVERVIRLVDAAEYKRRQYPPGPKISLKAFGRDRRLPITSRWREQAAPGVADPDRIRPEQTTPG